MSDQSHKSNFNVAATAASVAFAFTVLSIFAPPPAGNQEPLQPRETYSDLFSEEEMRQLSLPELLRLGTERLEDKGMDPNDWYMTFD